MLDFRHKIGPGFLVLIAFLSFGGATILQLLVSIGLPTIRTIHFLSFTLEDLGQDVRFGLWTICTSLFFSSFSMSDDGETCQPSSLGYQGSQFGPIADFLLISGLPKALVMQPIATGFSGFATLACLLHLCSNWLIWPFIAFLAGATGILAFVLEIVLFATARNRLSSTTVSNYFGQGISESSFGPAIWIQLAAALMVGFGVLMSWSAYIARKVKKTHTGKLGTSTRGSVYDESQIGSPYGNEKKSAKPKGLFAMSSSAPKGAKVGKGGLLARFRGGGDKDSNDSAVAMRNMAAPVAGVKGTNDERRASKHARISHMSGSKRDDYSDISGRRRSRASVGGYERERGFPRRASGPAGGSAVSGTRAARTAALAGGVPLAPSASRGSRGGGSVKSAYSSRRHSEGARRHHHQRRRSETSDEDVFHEVGEDHADLGYLLGARPYSYPAGRSRETVVSAERSQPRDRSRSRPRDVRRSSDNYAVRRKAPPRLDDGEDEGGAYRSGGSRSRTSPMTRYASEPLGEENAYVSPKRGRRSARYSARATEAGWD